jgi:hypothetical protein
MSSPSRFDRRLAKKARKLLYRCLGVEGRTGIEDFEYPARVRSFRAAGAVPQGESANRAVGGAPVMVEKELQRWVEKDEL